MVTVATKICPVYRCTPLASYKISNNLCLFKSILLIKFIVIPDNLCSTSLLVCSKSFLFSEL